MRHQSSPRRPPGRRSTVGRAAPPGRAPGDPGDADERQRGGRDRAADEQAAERAAAMRAVEVEGARRRRGSSVPARIAPASSGSASRRRRRRRGERDDRPRAPTAGREAHAPRRARRAGPRAAPRTGTTDGRGRGRGAGVGGAPGSGSRPRLVGSSRRRPLAGGAAARRGSGRRRGPRPSLRVAVRRTPRRHRRGAPVAARAPSPPTAAPRWISTRTAPSDRPRTPAISAVRHLVDEAQERAPGGDRRAGRPSARSASARLVAGGGAAPRVLGSATTSPAPSATSSEAAGRRRCDRRSFATTLRAIRNSQTRNVEASVAVLGARELLEPRQAPRARA